MTGPLLLVAPAEPSLALVVRTFVAEGSRFFGIDPEICEDLRLAADELFACGVEAGTPVRVRLEAGDEDVTLTVEGVDSLSGPEGIEGAREQMLRALFGDLRHEDRTVSVRAPLRAELRAPPA